MSHSGILFISSSSQGVQLDNFDVEESKAQAFLDMIKSRQKKEKQEEYQEEGFSNFKDLYTKYFRDIVGNSDIKEIAKMQQIWGTFSFQFPSKESFVQQYRRMSPELRDIFANSASYMEELQDKADYIQELFYADLVDEISKVLVETVPKDFPFVTWDAEAFQGWVGEHSINDLIGFLQESCLPMVLREAIAPHLEKLRLLANFEAFSLHRKDT